MTELDSLRAENAQLRADIESLNGEIATLKILTDLQKEATFVASEVTRKADGPKPQVHWCAEIPDADDSDRRPAFDAAKGWETPEVLAWGKRQLAKKGGA